MEKYEHFSHQHKLSFHKSLEGGAQIITCTGCKFPCSDASPIYSCRPCKFFLHQQCFDATRSLLHPTLHPDHPLSLFPSPTYPSGSFVCNLCNQTGSGFCFCCTTCEFDLHIHCAYKNNNTNTYNNALNYKVKSETSSPPPNHQIIHKGHPDHLLKYLSKSPYGVSRECWCDLCGAQCDSNSPVYHCDICKYDLHIGCVDLPQIAKREDHEHELSLLEVNPHESFECDVCKCMIEKKHCMYLCKSGCDYGMHVQCVSAAVAEKPKMDAMSFELEMFKLQNQMKVHQMMIDTKLMGISGYNHNRYYRY